MTQSDFEDRKARVLANLSDRLRKTLDKPTWDQFPVLSPPAGPGEERL